MDVPVGRDDAGDQHESRQPNLGDGLRARLLAVPRPSHWPPVLHDWAALRQGRRKLLQRRHVS